MSHLKERTEKNCLNCQTELIGRYCHVCGQENLEPKESVWHLISHFFEDITHFDGKFFSTVKYLITKPGFLSKEYMLGRRASYLNPIRMYVFTSAFFFLIFFSLTNVKRLANEKAKESVTDLEMQIANLKNEIKKGNGDSVEIEKNIKEFKEDVLAVKKVYGDTTTKKFSKSELASLLLKTNLGSTGNIKNQLNQDIPKHIKEDATEKPHIEVGVMKSKYKSLEAYDSAQKALSPDRRDGWFKSMYEKKVIEIAEKYDEDTSGFKEHFLELFFHSFPKILIISLPFFALLLKLVYVRSKQFYYTSHGIFSIHVYCATFILLLFLILSNWLQSEISWKWFHVLFGIFNICVWLYLLIYLYEAMRRFYGQGWLKTLAKYLIVCFFAVIINVTLLAFFVFISAISI